MSLRPVQTKIDPCWKAEELRRLPAPEREAILLAAAVHAEADYLVVRELTDFKAFSEEKRAAQS